MGDMSEDMKIVSDGVVELTDEDLGEVSGGRMGSVTCSCGRGPVYKNNMCRHCYEALQNK